MTIKEVLQHDKEFRYMLLSRLQQDCIGYLCNGYNPSRLWAGNVKDQIKYMRALWKSFPDTEKPVWLSWEDINSLEAEMALASNF